MQENIDIANYRRYLKVEKYLKIQTINNYCFEISLFVVWLDNTTKELNYSNVNFNNYFAYRFKNKNFTRSYTNKIQQYLKSFYNWLETSKQIEYNPALKLNKATPEKRIPNIFNLYEIDLIQKQFTTSTKDLRDLAIIELLLSTGLRINEALSLSIIDYKNKNYSVQCKGDFERLIVINPTAINKIENYLAKRNIVSKFLFCNAKGEKITASYFNKMLKIKCKSADIIKKVSAHTFRHTYASLLFEGGANIIEIKKLLGHQSVTSTEIYTKINVEHLRKEMRYHPRW